MSAQWQRRVLALTICNLAKASECLTQGNTHPLGRNAAARCSNFSTNNLDRPDHCR